ncbi:hypothetical protein RvY_06284 [Ramazzottius varieornatus]|uniref:Uncharacterized protein n=1 Tax=Ramazzottius varieornatus TaxID=947166 RepID=A0A1D1V6Q9_RAMVA|nr:hypothetical protein RvY_06284 [Ramazzottius varieornatus]
MSKDEQESSAVQHELDTARRKYQELLLESQTMRAKVICLDSEKSEAQKEVKRLKEALVAQKRDLNSIQEHLHAKRQLESQIDNHKRQIIELQSDLDRFRDLLKETENEAAKYQNQYQDSLDLVEKLTANNVDLKIKVSSFSSEVDVLNKTHKALQAQYCDIQRLSSEQKDIMARLSSELESCRTDWTSENERLQHELQAKDSELQKLRKAVDDGENDKRLTVRMYNATLKDLKRQLAQAAKSSPLNGLENGHGDHSSESPNDRLSLHSRASSSSSLDISPLSLHTSASCHGLSNGEDDAAPSPQSAVDLVDRSVLIDKILRLQRELAKKDERCDFLEEHIALLTQELKRRCK